MAVREAAREVRFHEEDIVDRLSALGRAINGIRDTGEL